VLPAGWGKVTSNLWDSGIPKYDTACNIEKVVCVDKYNCKVLNYKYIFCTQLQQCQL